MGVHGPGVVEAVPVVFKVLQQTLRTSGGVRGVVPLGQPLQRGKKVSPLPRPQLFQPPLPPAMGRRLSPERFSRSMQMLRRMIEVQQLRYSWKVGLGQVPDPGSSITQNQAKVPLIQISLLQLMPQSLPERLGLFPPRHIKGGSNLTRIKPGRQLHFMPVQTVLVEIGQARNHHAIDS